jgi:hypothetical protein
MSSTVDDDHLANLLEIILDYDDKMGQRPNSIAEQVR